MLGIGGMDITWNYTILKGFRISSSSEHNEKTKNKTKQKQNQFGNYSPKGESKGMIPIPELRKKRCLGKPLHLLSLYRW